MSRFLAKVHAVLVVLGCLLPMVMPRAAQAVPVVISTEGLPAIDVAQRDSLGTLRLFDAEDADGDGMISLVADLDPVGHSVGVHIASGPSKSFYVLVDVSVGVDLEGGADVSMLITGTEERVITHWNSPPTIPFTLGQPVSVADGAIAGLDAVVYRSPGFESAADIVDLDLTTLPLYTGPAEAGGLIRFQVIPEPSGAMLCAAACCGLASLRFIRRRRAIVSA